MGAFARLRSEAVLFLGANVMGAGIAAILDPGAVAAALAAVGTDPAEVTRTWQRLLAEAAG